MAWTRSDLATPSLLFLPMPISNRQAPASCRLESFGTMLRRNRFELNNKPRRGWKKLPGGTTGGGIVFLPPEVDIFDIAQKFAPTGVVKSPTYVTVSGGASFAAGLPYTNLGALQTGYSWLADDFGALIFRHHDVYSSFRSAVRFTETERIGFRALTNFWGDFNHANTANRLWQVPDLAGTVLVSPSPETGMVQHGKANFGAGTTSVVVTFPTAYAVGTIPKIVVTLERTGSIQGADISVASNTGFTFRRSAAAGAAIGHWIAIGAI